MEVRRRWKEGEREGAGGQGPRHDSFVNLVMCLQGLGDARILSLSLIERPACLMSSDMKLKTAEL